jgi:hypothetical protein
MKTIERGATTPKVRTQVVDQDNRQLATFIVICRASGSIEGQKVRGRALLSSIFHRLAKNFRKISWCWQARTSRNALPTPLK